MKSQIHEHQNQNSKKMSVKINFKTILIGIAILILLITGLTTSCKKSTCTYVPCTVRDSINVSTGLDDSGMVDSNWKVIASPFPPGTPAIVMKPGHSSWQLTPIVNTNAGWINCTGAGYTLLNRNGTYVYETSFTISPNTLSFSCDFNLAYDDGLVLLELEEPSTTIHRLTEPPHAPMPLANLGQNIGTVFSNPAVGSWKIRATIRTADNGTGLLLSGYIKTLKPC